MKNLHTSIRLAVKNSKQSCDISDFQLLTAAMEESGSLFSLLCRFHNCERTFGTKLTPLMRLYLYRNKCEIMRWEEHCWVQDLGNMLMKNIKREIWPSDWLIAKLLLVLASRVILGSGFHGTHELILFSDGSEASELCR
jgi:hypothetical protein